MSKKVREKRAAEIAKYNKIYSILVKLGGASERMRDAFIFYHIDEENRSFQEWRFQGKLMFGGKYRGGENRVDCYSEHSTQERRRYTKGK